MPRYSLRMLLILGIPAVVFAVLGGWYGYSAAIAQRLQTGNNVVANAFVAGLLGLAIGAALCAVLSYGVRFTIREVLLLTALAAMGAGWWVDRTTDRQNFQVWQERAYKDFTVRIQESYESRLSRLAEENKRLQAAVATESQIQK